MQMYPQVWEHGNSLDMLIDQVANLTATVAAAQAQIAASAQIIGEHKAEIEALKAAGGSSNCATCQNSFLKYIMENGLYIGKWWFGSYADQLFAVDTKHNSYYRFASNKTADL